MSSALSAFVSSLTDEQQAVVSHASGHARVSAVAGSGKTTTMVARIGHLLQQEVAPERIMVLMFNRSARDGFEQAMKRRLAGMSLRQFPEIRTFHSLGARLVDSFTKRSALPSFRLETRDTVVEKLAQQAGGQARRDLGSEGGWLGAEELADFLTFIDLVKSTGAGEKEVYKKCTVRENNRFYLRGYQLFEDLRRQQKIRFYSDLIHAPLIAMQCDSSLQDWVANRIDYIVVDEYQDINEAQQQLLKILAGDRAQVMVVGDVDQCIYEWRGARPEYIISRFATDFPDPVNYMLSHTFRYGHQLSLAANHLIGHNSRRDRKLCVSHRRNPVTTVCVRSEEPGLSHPVVGILADWQGGGRSLDEAVILVRLYAQSVVVELALLEAQIPYRIEGGAELFSCPEILALTGYCHLAANSLSGETLQRRAQFLEAMFSQPHLGIPQERIGRLAESAAGSIEQIPELLQNWAQGDLPEFLRKRFLDTAEKFRRIMAMGSSRPAHQLLTDIVEILELYEFYRNLSARAATAENRVKTCQALIEFSRSRNFLVQDLLTELETLKRRREIGGKGILITSVHRAKGLEWPLVILPGLENGLFPFCKGQDKDDQEDERRLFYVAMTRAMERLVCVHPVELSFSQSQVSLVDCSHGVGRVSRFLQEARPGYCRRLGELLENKKQGRGRLAALATEVARDYLKAVDVEIEFTGDEQPSEPIPDTRLLRMEEIAEGLEVIHPSFGPGVVTTIKDRKQGRLMVDFPGTGEVMLLAAYARLQSSS